MSAPDANGVRSAQVKLPDINYGKNQIQVRYDTQKVSSSFVYDSASTESSPGAVGSASPASLLVPIKTRVLRNDDPTVATNWGIQVGSNVYYSNVPLNSSGTPCSGACNSGFQILLLSRQDLSVVSNTSYQIASFEDLGNLTAFQEGLLNMTAPVSGCGQAGCIMVMQSLSLIGPMPCYGTSLDGCANLDSAIEITLGALSELGASGSVLWANGLSANVAYSFIGNAGSGNLQNKTGGTQFERLGCSDTRYQHAANICDSLSSFNSSQNSPADPTKIGAITGVLVRDNYNSFTYAPNAPLVSYTFGNKPVNGVLTNVVSINGSTEEGNGQYSMALPNGVTGGFRVFVLDRNDPTGGSCLSCSSGAKQLDMFFDMNGAVNGGLDGLIDTLTNFGSGNAADALIFLASIGDISHSDEDPKTSSTWDRLANTVTTIGGDYLTFKILGDTHPAFNADHKDDYLLVGRPIPAAGLLQMPRFNGQETGYVITRHTVNKAATPTNVEGVLALDREGYYTPRLQGSQQNLIVPQTTQAMSASLLAPVAWPYSTTSGQQAAYTWLSSQLCCSDIRASYINRNISPGTWLTQLDQLSYPSDQSASFTQTDFEDVKGQLELEFNYVGLIRNLESNINALYQSQQSDVALILEQAEGDVQADIYQNTTPPPSKPSGWSALTSDVFPTLANLAGFVPVGGNAIKTALGLGTLAINLSADRSNDASGNSQLMRSLAAENVEASKLARYAIDQYTDSLITLGNDFNRILSDWGRMRALGGPLAAGQMQWDSAAQGYFLRAFNLTARRQYYPLLLQANPNFVVYHVQYGDYQYNGDDSHNVYNGDDQCTQSIFHNAQDSGGYFNGQDLRGTAWYPGVLQSSNGQGLSPGAYWWDIWALGYLDTTNQYCPAPDYGALPNTFGMFDPMDQNSTSGLGLWKPYVFGRWTGATTQNNNEYFSSVP
jgi:hypothetical protein